MAVTQVDEPQQAAAPAQPDGTRRFLLFFGGMLATYAAAAVLLNLGWVRASKWRIAPVAIAGAIALVVLTRQMRGYRERDGSSRWLRAGLAGGMLGVGGIAFLTGLASKLPLGFGLLALTFAFLGAGQVAAEIRASARGRRWSPWLMIACGMIVAAGVVITAPGREWAAYLIVGGLALWPFVMGAATERAIDWIDRDPPARRARVASFGAAAIVVGVGVLALLGALPWYLFITCAVVFGLVWAVSADTNADVIIVIALIAVVWANSPRDASTRPSLQPAAGDDVFVSFGDSYMSGEGPDKYFAATNQRKVNECRRSPQAYTVRLAESGHAGVPSEAIFLACSGADAVHIYEKSQYSGEPGGAAGGLDQLDNYANRAAAGAFDVGFVLVMIGGNDAGFGNVGRTCLGPGDCSAVGQHWLTGLERLEPKLEVAYGRVRDAFPDVPVVVVPYPNPIAPHACRDSTLTDNEHVFLNGFTRELDRVIASAARNAGFYVVDTMEEAFEVRGERLCDGDNSNAAVNFVDVNPVGGLVEQSANPRNWFHNSLHPRDKGHDRMATVITAWFDGHVDAGGELPLLPQPLTPNARYDVPDLPTVMGDPGFVHCAARHPGLNHCDPDPDRWFLSQLIGLLRSRGPLALLAAAGAWMLIVAGMSVSKQRRRVSSSPAG